MTDLPIASTTEGTLELFSTSDLQDYLSLSKSAFYNRLRELDINPRKVGKGSWLTQEQVTSLVDLHRYLSDGGTIAAFKERLSAGSAATIAPVALVAPGSQLAPVEPEPEHDPYDFNKLETLDRAADRNWLLTTSMVAQLIDVVPSTVSSQGQSFRALGFTFTRTAEKWKGSIQWRVSR